MTAGEQIPAHPLIADSVVIIGCGDHARVVTDILHASGARVEGCVDLRPPREAVPPTGLRLLGDLDTPDRWLRGRQAYMFVAAIGSNQDRKRAFERCVELGLHPVAAIHPTAIILGGAIVDPGAQVCAGAILGVAAHVHENAIVNTAASIDHDGEVRPHASVAPGAHLAGRVTVGTGAHVGIGASVREGIRIGDWALVGAGAAVVADVPPSERVLGVPARPLDGKC